MKPTKIIVEKNRKPKRTFEKPVSSAIEGRASSCSVENVEIETIEIDKSKEVKKK